MRPAWRESDTDVAKFVDGEVKLPESQERAYRKLLEFRAHLSSGSVLVIETGAVTCEVNTPRDFNDWVRETFPIFSYDQLHPAFMNEGER